MKIIKGTISLDDIKKLHLDIWGEKDEEGSNKKWDNFQNCREWFKIIDKYQHSNYNISYFDQIKPHEYGVCYSEMLDFRKKYNL